MESKKISVIVTIYNVEQYLRKCIDSILAQTHENFELILVNDGTPDNSLSICEEYAAKDNRIRIVNKENGGQASASNAGIEVATGDYIGFIDGDDWIEPNMYEVLLETADKYNSDIVQCCWVKVDPDGKKHYVCEQDIVEQYSSDDGLEELVQSTGKTLNTSVCCKLFKKSTIGDIRFPKLRACEDDEFVHKTIAVCNHVTCIGSPLYDYFNRENSISRSSFHVRYMALLPVQETICNILKDRIPEYYNIAQRVLCSKQFYILYQLNKHKEIENSKDLFNGVVKQILLNYESYMKNPCIGANKYMLYAIKFLPKCIWINLINVKFRHA